MSFNKIPLIGNDHSDETRNIINLMVQVINNRGIEILSDSAFLNWLEENGVKHRGEWSNTEEYDRQSVVLHGGASYTSKKQVPVGIDILDDDFWVLTGNYNAQIEYYRQDTRQAQEDIEKLRNNTNDNFENHENLKTSLERKFFPIDTIMSTSSAKEVFINEMNKKAEQLEMYDTTFMNPHGLRAVGQEMTARDMIVMGVQSLAYPKLFKAMGTREKNIDIKGDNARNVTISHTIYGSVYDDSTFARNYTVLGGKTGTLGGNDPVSNVLMFSSSRHYGGDFISAVINSQGDRYMDAMDGFNIANSEMRSRREFLPLETPYNNGNFINDLDGFGVHSGNPTMDYTDYLTHPASVNIDSDGISQQIRVSLSNRVNPGDVVYIYGYFKCNDYVKGKVGFQALHGRTEEAIIEEANRDWVKLSVRFTFSGNSLNVYAGSLANAELKGRMDSINFVNLTQMYGSNNIPSKSTLDSIDHMKVQNVGSSVITTRIPPTLTSYTRSNMPVYYEVNADDKFQPASVTKIMTGMITLDYFDNLYQDFEIIESDISGGSGSDYQSGDIISLNDALHSLMMESSNTMATALSRVVGKKIIIDSEGIGG